MSIVDEITRLTSAKANIKAAIEAKGVSVPSSAKLDAFPSYVSAISVGGENYEDEMITRDFQNWMSGTQLRYSNSRISSIGPYGLAGVVSKNYLPWGTVFSVSMTFPNVVSIGIYGLAYWSVNASVYLPEVQTIESYAFYQNASLKTVSAPKLKVLGTGAFGRCYALKSFRSPDLISIGEGAFRDCYSFTTLNCPNVETLGAYMLSSTEVSEVEFPHVLSIASSAFWGAKSLTKAFFAQATVIGDTAFRDASRLANISFPEVSYIGYMGLYGCSALTSLDFPKLVSVSADAFNQCRKVTHVSFPQLQHVGGGSAFYACYSLASAYFPKLLDVSNYAFCYCSELSTIRFDAPVSLLSYSAFHNCRKLLSVYLLGDSVAKLSDVRVFYSTPISTYTASTGGVRGSVFVPLSLLSDYTTATNWVTYSSRIVGLTDEEIAALPI